MRLIAVAVLACAMAFGGAGVAIGQDAEAVAWANVRTCNDLMAFIRNFPAGRYRAEADARMASMCGANNLPTVAPVNPSGGSASSGASPGYDPSSPAYDRSAVGGGAAPNAQQQVEIARMQAEERRRMQAEYERYEAQRRAATQLAQEQQQAAAAEKADRPPPKIARPSAPPPAPGSAPVVASRPSSVALPAGYEIVSHVLTPTESYLPKRDGMPTGIVLLDVREKTKNQSLCKALLGAKTATVKTEAQARRDNPNGDFLVTNWPVTGQVAHEDDCTELLAKYDFERATRIKGAYALGGSRGPFFLALDPTGEIVFLDLKDASAEEVFKATSDWMKLALASPQNRPAAEQRLGLVAGTNRLFAELASGFGSLVGANPAAPALISFNDPVKGTARQFNIYKAGVYLIGATFKL